MVVKNLKSNSLVLSYEFLSSDTGKNLKRKQAFTFLPLDASDDDLYDMGVSIGSLVVAPPKTIEQGIVYTLMEG
ncbi:MAG: hypothetical protein FWC47_02235 [Oscillospiraceae bacterium]|nr:hypothetical protein [Oscillospiraceae bacterium]